MIGGFYREDGKTWFECGVALRYLGFFQETGGRESVNRCVDKHTRYDHRIEY